MQSIFYGLSKGFETLHLLSANTRPQTGYSNRVSYRANLQSTTLSQYLRHHHELHSSDMSRISPDEVSITSSCAYKDIYAQGQGRLSFPKEPLGFYMAMRRIVTANDADHSRMRTVLGHAFSNKAL